MADFYCDHGAYATNIGATPTWGVPQDGDGSATTAATASSVASVQFTANATGGSSSISVCGVTFTATTHFVVGGSLSITLDNLAAAINASTTTVGTSVAAGAPQLRNLVFARKSGAGNDTLEIMSRVGSAQCNNATNSNWSLTTANWTNNGVTNFAGGSGGCWGWLVNTAAIGVSSSIAALAYGVMVACPMMTSVTAQARPTNSDIVWVRTGDNPSLTYSATSCDLRRVVGGTTSSYPLHLIFDTNTKWTGDGATGVCTFNISISSGDFYPPGVTSASAHLDCQNYASSLKCLAAENVVFNITSTSTRKILLGPCTGTAGVTSANQMHLMSGVLFTDASSGSNYARIDTAAAGTGGGSAAGTSLFTYRDCRFSRTNGLAGFSVSALAATTSSNVQSRLRFIGCRFESNVSGASVNPIVDISVASMMPTFGWLLSFRQCSFTGFSGGGNFFPLHNSITSMSASLDGTPFLIEAVDCTGVSLAAAYAGISMRNRGSPDDVYAISLHSPTSGGPYRFENTRGIVEWNPSASPAQPTLAAVQPSGSAWSVHARWLSTTNAVGFGDGWLLPPLRCSYVNSTAARTIKLQALLSSALFSALVSGDMSVMFSYISDATGLVKTSTVAIPATSSASWTNASGYSGHVAKEFAFTTTDSVRQGTEIVAQIHLLGAPRSGSSESVFFDPELSIT